MVFRSGFGTGSSGCDVMCVISCKAEQLRLLGTRSSCFVIGYASSLEVERIGPGSRIAIGPGQGMRSSSEAKRRSEYYLTPSAVPGAVLKLVAQSCSMSKRRWSHWIAARTFASGSVPLAPWTFAISPTTRPCPPRGWTRAPRRRSKTRT